MSWDHGRARRSTADREGAAAISGDQNEIKSALESGSGHSPMRSRSSIRRRTSAIASAPSRSSPRSSAATPSAIWLRSTSRWEAKSYSRSCSNRSASQTTSSTDWKRLASSWARTSSFTSSASEVRSIRGSISARVGGPPELGGVRRGAAQVGAHGVPTGTPTAAPYGSERAPQAIPEPFRPPRVGFEPEGRGFESLPARHFSSLFSALARVLVSARAA